MCKHNIPAPLCMAFIKKAQPRPFAEPRIDYALSAAAQLISAHDWALRPCINIAGFMCKHNISALLYMAELFLQKTL